MAYLSSYDGFDYYHNDPVFHETITQGRSEPYPSDLAIVKRYLSLFPTRNRGYLDIGGHFGTTLIPFMRLYNNAIAFEPQPDNYHFLCQNVKVNQSVLGNKQILTKQVGVGNSTLKGMSVMHGSNSGCYFFKQDDNGTTQTIRLDDDEDVATMDIDFVKIDTEGAELDVLKGGLNTLLRTRPLIQVETNGLCEQNFNVKQHEVFDFLFNIGAAVFDDSMKDTNTYFYFP